MGKAVVKQLLSIILVVNLSRAANFHGVKDIPVHQQRWLANKLHLAQPTLPPHPRHDGQSVTVEGLKNPDFVRDGPAAKEQAFSKYGWDINATPTHTFARRTANVEPEATGMRKRQGQIGTVQAEPQILYSEYLCPVSIGGQTLMMNFGMLL